jgi:SAM-dependent methyltransferase
MIENAQSKWTAGLPDELLFLRKIIDGFHPQAAWVADLRERATGRLPFRGDFVRYATPPFTRILDVGAGPITILGLQDAPGEVEITAIDPLADAYNALLSEHHITPFVPTRPGEAERLFTLGLGQFDLVYSRNVLDHSYNPMAAIGEMLAVAKPTVAIVIEGFVNESINAQETGLHQWNFMPINTGDLIIWQRRGEAVAVRDALAGTAVVSTTGNEWFCVEIKPAH